MDPFTFSRMAAIRQQDILEQAGVEDPRFIQAIRHTLGQALIVMGEKLQGCTMEDDAWTDVAADNC